MKYNIVNNSLNIIINELGEEYKDLLVERILKELGEIDIESINPSDLIRIDVEVKANLRRNNRISKKSDMLSSISLIGLLYAMLGLFLMLWSEIQDTILYEDNYIMLMSFVLIFIGLFVSLFSLIFRHMIRMKPYYENKMRTGTVAIYEIINKWREVEALIYQLVPKSNELSLSSMLDFLLDTKILSHDNEQTIEELLYIRNQIMHNKKDESNFSQQELKKVLNNTDKVIAKMKKML